MAYARLSVLEPHRNGYGHIHDALWINDRENVLGETDIYPVLDAHLRAVDQAQPRNHGPDAVDVRHDPERQHFDADPQGVPPVTALSREVTKFLGGLTPHGEGQERNQDVPNVLQANKGPLRFYALLWASGIRQWRPDRTVFPHLVKASQEWYTDENATDDVETFPSPEDVSTSSGTETVDVNARQIAFEPFEAGDSAVL